MPQRRLRMPRRVRGLAWCRAPAAGLAIGHAATTFPAWLTEADVEFYAGEFKKAGFRGGLNWYRNIDRNWELMAPFAGAKVEVPALFMTGDKDLVYKFPGAEQLIANLRQFVPKLKKTVILPGCGHWTQQERKDDVNRELVAFLKAL